jgi:hypothetical protein
LVVLKTELNNTNELEFIQRIYESYLKITQDFSELIAQNQNLNNEWMNIGYKIVELKKKIKNKYLKIEKYYINSIEKEKNQKQISKNTTKKLENNYTKQEEDQNSLDLHSVNNEKNPAFSVKDGYQIEHNVKEVFDEKLDIKPEIRPIFGKETSESCGYCSIFKDIGTMVCPNCGRPLNLKILL